MNFNNHYHLVEKNTTALNIMSGIKSLVCDLNGIIIAEMVYRCMICDVVFETIPEVQIHYQSKHIDHNQDSLVNSNTSTNKSSNSTNISFLNSFQLPTDPILDNIPESPTPQTLTFDVPSGLKTLHQQFESSSKESPHKRKNSKSLTNDSKTKIGLNQKTRVLGHVTHPTIKSGFITCEICGATKFYKYTQRRFGVYSCVGCAKFYSKYLLKPIAYKVCENLGKCNLKVSECEPNGRCKACLIHKCRSKFIIDPKKLNNYRNESNGTKTKTNSKQNSVKESNKNIKSLKTPNIRTINVSIQPKQSKNSSTTTKTENYHKMSTTHITNKKSKLDRIQNKNGIQNKKNTNINVLSKGTADKTQILMKTKKNASKLSESQMESKRTRNQSVCRKCFASKIKECIHSGNGWESNKFKNREKTRFSTKRTQCLTRSKNK